MKKTITPVIGDKVIIELFRDELITEEYVSWLRDNKINKYLVSGSNTTSLYEIASYVKALQEKEDDFLFAVISKNDNIHIGNARLQITEQELKIGKFGMMIGNPNYHGKGIGTEVVRLVLKIAFEDLKLHKVFLEVVADNIPAIRIYEKNGFIVEGSIKNKYCKNNQFQDFLIMSILLRNYTFPKNFVLERDNCG